MPAVSVLAKAKYGMVDITGSTAAMLMSEGEDHFVAGTTEVTVADGVCVCACVCVCVCVCVRVGAVLLTLRPPS
jgi:hypothetical protein